MIFSLIFLLLSCGEEKIDHNTDWENFPSMNFEESVKTFDKSNKPILVLFNAIGCLNCRRFEKILKTEVGLKKIKDRYNFINLYLNDREKLPESEWFESSWFGTIKRKGGVNAEIQMEKLQSGDFPALAIMNKSGEIIKSEYAYGLNVKEFLELED